MKIISKKIKCIILAIVLIIISVFVIIFTGNTYEVNFNHLRGIDSIDSVDIKIEDENIVKIIDKKIENDEFKIVLKGISKGKTYVEAYVKNTEGTYLFTMYVHDFGIITFNEYMGDSNGSIIIPISFTVFLIYLLYTLIDSYKRNVKKSMYDYKNIAYLGIIIFTSFAVINEILSIFSYRGIVETIDSLINMFSFSMIFFPVSFVLSILMIISNITLVRKEGLNLKNLLGILLSALLCFMSILPDIMYNMLYASPIIDIHNQSGIALYIYNFVESIIKLFITYIECVLIGTIIMGIKSAKHIPNFDKDAIIILGCQIRKDGTLTPLLKSRVDRAIEFSKMQKEKTGKNVIFLPSGGKGMDEVISEADAMKKYLIDSGINEENIVVENKSKNTFENIKFSNDIITKKIKNAKIAFSTTNYHVFRAGAIAYMQNLNVEGIGSKTKSYFWINAFIREFIATLFSEKKKHIVIFLSIILLVIVMIALTYINNII